MPQASNQSIIVVLPEVIRIIRGQATSVNFTIHKDYVGNQININAASDVKVELLDNNLSVFATFQKSANTLSYGSLANGTQGQVSIPLTAEQTAALPLSSNNVNGEVWARFTVTQSINQVLMPNIKFGNIFDAGQNVTAGIVASRFTLPAPVYSVKSFNASDSVAVGEIALNTSTPASISKVKLSLTDDKGYRNGFIEAMLEDRFDAANTKLSLYLTNVDNNSEYTILEVTGYTRVDQDNADPLSPTAYDHYDAIELDVVYSDSSIIPGSSYDITVGQNLGIFMEAFATPGTTYTVDGVTYDNVTEVEYEGGIAANQLSDGSLKLTVSGGSSGVGTSGTSGIDGASAYELFVASLPPGSAPPLESDWLSSLNGQDGTSGTDGTSGLSGVDGVDGADGQDGSSGTSGTDGAQGPAGTNGTSGTSGNDGQTGAAGQDGSSGTSGVDGQEGTSGTDGTSGVDGQNGQDGQNGTSGTSGVSGTSGTDGQDGSSVNILGTLNAINELPQTGSQGDGYIIDGDLLIWNGSAWVNVGQFAGTDGTSGIDGVDGQDGTSGTDGTSGIDGQDGTSGTDGTSGVDGQDGTSGTDGSSGVDGTSGTDGTSGVNGTSGTSGVDGENGTSGTSGIDGQDGTSGTSGVNGQDGTSGTSGVNGQDGTSGTDGSSGVDGTSGTDGSSGTDGTSGVNGTSGTSGSSGLTGNDGTSGTSGVDGTSGIDGQNGTSGTSGVDGAQGDAGTSGTDGSSGTDGTSGIDGEQGPQGNPGTSGTSGVDGEQGPQGDAGTSGTDGSSGVNGTSGTDGTSGVDGEQGPQGNPGTSGTDGTSGISGTSGTDGTSGVDGDQGPQGEAGTSGTDGSSGVDGSSGTDGTSGVDGSDGIGIAAGGATGEALIKASGTDYDVTWGTVSGGGATKYLLRLEYDASNHLVNNTTANTFVNATGFETSGASVDSVSVNTNTAIYSVNLTFSGESNPPTAIMVMAWDPTTYKYEMHPYRVDAADFNINTVSTDFTESGGQWTPDIFGGFGTTSLNIDVRQSYIKYGNAVAFPPPSRLSHAYLVFIF